MTRQLNKESIELIKSFEGLRLKAYYDIADVLTIGYGHTNRAGTWKFDSNTVISEKQAEQILRKDLGKIKSVIDKNVKVDLNDNEYGALVSLGHNIGPYGLARSTVVRRLNASDREGAAAAFLMWNKATVNGKKVTVRGLTRRRQAEMELFLKPVENDVVEYVTNETVVAAEGGEMKSIGKSKTAWFGGLTILGAASQISEIGVLIPQIVPYSPYILLVVGAAIIINRWLESRKGEH